MTETSIDRALRLCWLGLVVGVPVVIVTKHYGLPRATPWMLLSLGTFPLALHDWRSNWNAWRWAAVGAVMYAALYVWVTFVRGSMVLGGTPGSAWRAVDGVIGGVLLGVVLRMIVSITVHSRQITSSA